MVDNKKRAFTLIEMLVVVVIIGIILAIVFSSATNIINNRSKKLYQVHMDLVETATSNYIDQYKGQLSNSDSSCFIIDYNTLISDGLVKETDIHCNGNIILSRVADSNNFQKNYYLSCVDQNEEPVKTSDKVPSGCRGFNGKFKMEYAIYEDSSQTIVYDGESYIKDAYVFFNSTSPYASPISYYEYSLNLESNWTQIVSGSNLATINDIKNFVGTLYVRSVDQAGNISSNVLIPVKMDNTGPTFNTSVSGTYLTKTISVFDVKDKGIGTLAELAYSFDGGKTWQKEMTKSVEANGTYKVCSRDLLGNTACKEVAVTGIDRVAPNPPTITASDSKESGTWHSSNFTLTLSGANNTSGNTYYYGETNNPTEVGATISISSATSSKIYYMKVCSGAGLCSNVTSYEVKLDKTTPSAPMITASDSKESGTWHYSSFTLNYSGASNISGNTYYYGTSTNPTTVGTSTTINTNTSETGTAYYVKVCSGAGLCSGNSSYVTKLDTATPTVTAVNSSNYITTSTGANITSYYTASYGVSGGSTVCQLGATTITNTNQLALGVNTVTCTATGTNGKTNSVNITFRHQYNATAHCSGGRTLSNGNCTYYYSGNESQCGCSSWNSCQNSACGTTNYSCQTAACGVASYKSCANEAACGCGQYRCTLYKKCTKCTCSTWSSITYNCDQQLFTRDCNSALSGGTGTASFSTGRYSACGTETVYGSECNNASSKVCNSINSCQTAACGVASYNSCQNSACGSYTNTCQTSACGCAQASSCTKTENQYLYYQCDSTGNNGTNGTLSGTTCSF